MTIMLSILPIALVIAAGYALAKSGILPRDTWSGIETLSFRALIPAVLIVAIAGSDLSLDRFGGFLVALLVALFAVAGLVFALKAVLKTSLDTPSFTTLFQTSIRWNAFVALAAADQLLPGGLEVIAVAIAILIPTINILCILVMAGYGPGSATLGGVVSTVLRNPLVQACVIGLALNFGKVTLPQPIFDAIEMIGRGALAVGLMAIGAGISLRRLGTVRRNVLIGIALRPVVAPALFAGIAIVLGLSPLQTLAGVMVFAAPCASNGYIVAKQMGGNAPLYADILTWQTLLSLVVLPIWAALLL